MKFQASLDLILERVTDILAYIDLQEKSLYSNCDTENGKENCPEFLKVRNTVHAGLSELFD